MRARSPSTYKIVIFGPSEVGKTQFLNRLVDGEFESQYYETNGIEYIILPAYSGSSEASASEAASSDAVNIQFWEISGSEGLKPRHQSQYFKDAELCLFFIELADHSELTLDDFNNKYQPYLEVLKNFHNERSVILVFTKRDFYQNNNDAANWTASEVLAGFKRKHNELNIFSNAYIVSANTNTKAELGLLLDEIMVSLRSPEERYEEDGIFAVDEQVCDSASKLVQKIVKKVGGEANAAKQKRIIRNFFLEDEDTKDLVKKLSIGELVNLFDIIQKNIKHESNSSELFHSLFSETGGFCMFGCYGSTQSSQKVLRRIKCEIINKLKASPCFDQSDNTFDRVRGDEIMRVINKRVGRNIPSALSRMFRTTNSHKKLKQAVENNDQRTALRLSGGG